MTDQTGRMQLFCWFCRAADQMSCCGTYAPCSCYMAHCILGHCLDAAHIVLFYYHCLGADMVCPDLLLMG